MVDVLTTTGISQILSKVLAQFFGLDTYLSMMISSLIVSNYAFFITFFDQNFSLLIGVMILSPFFYFFLKKNFSVLGKIKSLLVKIKIISPVSTLNINAQGDLLLFFAFRDHPTNKNYFSKCRHLNIGNVQNILDRDSNEDGIGISEIYDTYHSDVVYFDIPFIFENNEVKRARGYYSYKNKSYTKQKVIVSNKVGTLLPTEVSVATISITLYSDECITFWNALKREATKIKSSFYEIRCGSLTPSQSGLNTVRNGTSSRSGFFDSLQKINSIYRDTLYGKHLRDVYDSALHVHYSAKEYENRGFRPRLQVLLHGPGGSGKTDLVRRISQSTGRHIIRPDFLEMTKEQCIRCFTSPSIDVIGNLTINQTIIVIDEVCTLIRELYRREKKHISVKNSCLNEDSLRSSEDDSLLVEESRRRDSPPRRSSRDRDAPRNQDKKPSPFDSLPKERKIFLSDLLTILDGPVCYDGLILIATTNNYEKMTSTTKESDSFDEELVERVKTIFRPGRLTPVYCGNLTNEMLDEMCRFHFGKAFDWGSSHFSDLNISDYNICVSSVITTLQEVIFKSSLNLNSLFAKKEGENFTLSETQPPRHTRAVETSDEMRCHFQTIFMEKYIISPRRERE